MHLPHSQCTAAQVLMHKIATLNEVLRIAWLTSPLGCAVQFVTFMKKHLALKPALHRMQRQRAAVRHFQTPQITEMY